MNYNVRIDDNFLKANHSDGEVLQHTDLNELESVVKAAINANYLDIQKLEDGTISVAGATSLKGTDGVATLSQLINESLQPSDNKIPTSLQVKNFVENVVNTANTGLVFYWDGTGGQEGANIFNQICSKYDNNGKFVFYGRFYVDVGYDKPSGEHVEIPRDIIAPIMVNKLTDRQTGNKDYLSFSFPPVFLGHKYSICSIELTGDWGKFTDVKQMTWSDSMAPVTKQYVDSSQSSTPIIFAPIYDLNVSSSDLKDDGRILTYFSASFNDITENLLNEIGSVNTQVIYNLTINNISLTFIGLVTSLEKTDTVSKATIELTSLGIKNDILDKTKYAHYKATHSPHWEANTEGNFLRISNGFTLTRVQI